MTQRGTSPFPTRRIDYNGRHRDPFLQGEPAMDDLRHLGTFLLIFAAMLMGYGTLLARTGNKDLMPMRAVHSVHGPDEVRHVGRLVIVVGCCVIVAALLLRFLPR